MLRALGRIILLPIAFVLAAAATLFVIFSLGQERVVQAMSGRGPDEVPIGAVSTSSAWRCGSPPCTPWCRRCCWSSSARRRASASALYYIVGGGVALAVVPLLTRLGQPASVLELSPVVWQVLATAGFAGGFVYWLLAGPQRLIAVSRDVAPADPPRCESQQECASYVTIAERAKRQTQGPAVLCHAVGADRRRAGACRTVVWWLCSPTNPIETRWSPTLAALVLVIFATTGIAALSAIVGGALRHWQSQRLGDSSAAWLALLLNGLIVL